MNKSSTSCVHFFKCNFGYNNLAVLVVMSFNPHCVSCTPRLYGKHIVFTVERNPQRKMDRKIGEEEIEKGDDCSFAAASSSYIRIPTHNAVESHGDDKHVEWNEELDIIVSDNPM